MYDYFRGQLVEKSPLSVVIEVQGIGYKCHTPLNLFPNLPQTGKEALLYVSFVVREMSQALYAFGNKEDRDLFELLLTLSGIGPKTALGLVGHFEALGLEEAVRRENSAALAKVPGIGKKTAERLILELKGKLKLPALAKTGQTTKREDALSALLHLGCPPLNAEQAVRRALEELTEECDLPSLITTALKYQR